MIFDLIDAINELIFGASEAEENTNTNTENVTDAEWDATQDHDSLGDWWHWNV